MIDLPKALEDASCSCWLDYVHLVSAPKPNSVLVRIRGAMAGEGPSWADQWGAGGIGAIEEEDNVKANKEAGSNKKMTATSAGLTKAKAAAMAGAQKVKSGTSMGIKWVKNKCQKKKSSPSE
ncbi:hypothetical protein F0562_018875 [Nyssa sinensis]|uniref:Uncharacterized protein n=1 Tax=Nyssa sinensis TaxID=561372 RepID=A0A5J4ZCL4_9ASTE|nr:hypothetical protein F0562_018875 [Nyssa sinensis]